MAVVNATAPNSAGSLGGGSAGAPGGIGARVHRPQSGSQAVAAANGPHPELSAAGSSPISSVLAAATSSGQSGLGFVLLGLLLAAAAGVAAGAALRQRALRRRAPGS